MREVGDGFLERLGADSWGWGDFRNLVLTYQDPE